MKKSCASHPLKQIYKITVPRAQRRRPSCQLRGGDRAGLQELSKSVGKTRPIGTILEDPTPPHSKSRLNTRNRAPNIRNRASTFEIALQHSKSRFNIRNHVSTLEIALQIPESRFNTREVYLTTRKHTRTLENTLEQSITYTKHTRTLENAFQWTGGLAEQEQRAPPSPACRNEIASERQRRPQEPRIK